MVTTPEGKLSHYFYGVNYSARDLRFGLIESSQNKIGSMTEQLSLYCYQYDPKTGKYGAAVMRLLRISGVITLLGIVALIVFLKPRNRQQVAKITKAKSV
jgi:protein SCO1/2